jgi:(2Fe-2S) ferredoxin
MWKVSVIALAVVLSGAGVWYAQINRRETNRAVRAVITGNVIIDGSSLNGNQAALLKSSLAVDGDLHLRRLPDGKVALEGNLNVRRLFPN